LGMRRVFEARAQLVQIKKWHTAAEHLDIACGLLLASELRSSRSCRDIEHGKVGITRTAALGNAERILVAMREIARDSQIEYDPRFEHGIELEGQLECFDRSADIAREGLHRAPYRQGVGIARVDFNCPLCRVFRLIVLGASKKNIAEC